MRTPLYAFLMTLLAAAAAPSWADCPLRSLDDTAFNRVFAETDSHLTRSQFTAFSTEEQQRICDIRKAYDALGSAAAPAAPGASSAVAAVLQRERNPDNMRYLTTEEQAAVERRRIAELLRRSVQA